MIQTSPIAVELQVPSLFIKPLKKNTYYHNIKKVISLYSEQSSDQETNHLESESFRAIFWRKVLKGEIIELILKFLRLFHLSHQM